MPNAIGLTASLFTRVATAYDSYQTLYKLSSGIRSAPRHIQIVLQDLEDYYLVSETLQSLLLEDGFQFKASPIRATSESLIRVLESSIAVFEDLSTIIATYQECGTLEEIEDLRRAMNAQKLTLITAISATNLNDLNSANTKPSHLLSDVAKNVDDLHESLAVMQLEMEDVRAARLPAAPKLVDIERAALRTDYRFALRHYLGDARSECANTPSPSMQVSSLCDSDSVNVSTLYHTALTHIDGSDRVSVGLDFSTQVADALNSGRFFIMLTVYGAPGLTPLNFSLWDDRSVGGVKKLVAGRLELLNQDPQEFRLRYKGRILDEDCSLQWHGIQRKAILDYEAIGPQFPRVTDLPDDHDQAKT